MASGQNGRNQVGRVGDQLRSLEASVRALSDSTNRSRSSSPLVLSAGRPPGNPDPRVRRDILPVEEMDFLYNRPGRRDRPMPRSYRGFPPFPRIRRRHSTNSSDRIRISRRRPPRSGVGRFGESFGFGPIQKIVSRVEKFRQNVQICCLCLHHFDRRVDILRRFAEYRVCLNDCDTRHRLPRSTTGLGPGLRI